MLDKIEKYKKMLDDNKITEAPNANGLSYLGMKGYISLDEWKYLELVNKVYELYPEKYGIGIRINLAKELLNKNKTLEAIDYLIPLVDEAKKRSVFWEYCSNWTFREAEPIELEGLLLLTQLYLKNKDIDKGLEVLNIINQNYPFRVKTIDSFLLFKEYLKKINRIELFKDMISKQLILVNSKQWKELALPINEEFKKMSLQLIDPELMKQNTITVKFHKFETEKYIMVIAQVIPSTSLVTYSFDWNINGDYSQDKVFANFIIIDKININEDSIKLVIKDKDKVVFEDEFLLDMQRR